MMHNGLRYKYIYVYLSIGALFDKCISKKLTLVLKFINIDNPILL